MEKSTNYLEWWLGGKEATCQCKRPGFDPWVRKIPWRRKWQATPVSLPGESHQEGSLVGYSPQGRKELDMTKQLKNSNCSVHSHIKIYLAIKKIQLIDPVRTMVLLKSLKMHHINEPLIKFFKKASFTT